MADVAITQLTPANEVNPQDSFVLQQGTMAKRLTGQTLMSWLLQAMNGHGGINNISSPTTVGLVDTYTIT